jgi:ELWxxDGT repeat protein
MITFGLNAQKRLTDFYSTELATEVPTNFIEFNGKAYFMATDATHGRNLWVSDGTKAGTRFFLETEPNRPETNTTYYFKTDSILYVFSNQNLWQIDKKHIAKRLNQQPLIITRYINQFDDKLFFNSVEYYDLRSKSLQKVTLNNIKPLTDDNLSYFNDCTQSKLRAFSFYENVSGKKNNFYVLEPKQTVCTELSLGSTFSSGVPSKIYKLKGNYFGAINRQGIYKFTPDKEPEKIGGYFQSVIYQNQVGEKLYFLSAQDAQITQYVFDGEKIEQISNKIYEWNSISSLYPISKDSLFYSYNKYSTNVNKIQVVQLDKLGELTVKYTLPDNTNLGSIVNIKNDSLISFAHSLSTYHSSQKTTILNFKKFTTAFVELGEITLLPNGEFIGQRPKTNSKVSSMSLFNLNKNEFLVETIPTKSRPTSLGMAFDILNKTLFVGLNEYDNLKSIYAFKPDSEQGKRIFVQQDSSFVIRKRLNFNGESYISDDIYLYTTDNSENISQIGEYGFTEDFISRYKSYVYDHRKNTTVEGVNSGTLYQLQNRKYEIDNDKIREVDFNYRYTTLKTYYFPTKLQENRIFKLDDKLYFWGQEGGVFDNQLFVFDGNDKSFKRLVDEPVHSVYNFKNRLVVILKTGQVRILDTKNAFESYFLMNIELGKNQDYNFFRDFEDFFVITSDNKLYYSDGDCQNSGLIEVPQRDGFWNANKIRNSKYYVLSNQSEFFICKGKSVKAFPEKFFVMLGGSNKNLYYMVGIENKSLGYVDKNEIYQYNLATYKTTLIDTAAGYSYYSDNIFREVIKAKKWELIIGNKQITITDGGKNVDKIEISQTQNTNVSSYIVFSENNNTLLIVGKELILRNNAKNTTLITLKPNEYWQQFYYAQFYLQSDEYFYLPISDGLMRKIIRVNKKDFTLKIIDIPFGVRPNRTSFDTETFYPIALVGNRLYAIIESPNEGRQLWLLDETKQNQRAPDFNNLQVADVEFIGNKDCAIARLSQLIPTEKVGQYGIFPNPTSKYLFLNLPKDQRQSIEQIEIYDSIGRLISNQLIQNSFSINPDLISLSLPDLATGMYFLKVNLSSTSLNFKFMVGY